MAEDTSGATGRETIDIHVGARLRSRRKALGITQDELGRALGVSFQQIQKYERGSNRISSARLFEVARVLKVSIGYFYQGLDHTQGVFERFPAEKHVQDFLMTAEGIELAEAFQRVRGPKTRRRIADLIQAMIERS